MGAIPKFDVFGSHPGHPSELLGTYTAQDPSGAIAKAKSRKTNQPMPGTMVALEVTGGPTGTAYQRNEDFIYRSCRRKAWFPTRGSARHARRNSSPGLDVYKCKVCDGWHLGNKRRKG